MPLQVRQLSSSLLHASEGKHVLRVSQSCQQHIPAGAGEGVVVAHSSSHDATHTAKTTGSVGHPLMHADRDPPGHSLGLGLELGAAVVVAVVVSEQSCLHTEMQTSCASPATTEHAATHALMVPPGQSPGGGGEGELHVGPPTTTSTQFANNDGSGPTAGVPSVVMAPNQIQRTTVSP